MADDILDLTSDDNKKTVYYLLHHPRKWRQRAVERIDYASALWAERERTIHVNPLREFLRTEAGADAIPGLGNTEKKRARLILPITVFPRKPRIDLHITVAEKPAYLLSREDHGTYKAGYIKYLAGEIKIPDSKVLSSRFDEVAELENFLVSICSFSPWRWHEEIKGRYAEPNRIELLISYLGSYHGWGYTDEHGNVKIPTTEEISDWATNYGDKIGDLVRKNNRPSSRESATENPLLVLPMFGVGDIKKALEGLYNFLNDADGYSINGDGDSKNHATKLLDAYAFYGRYWIALTKCEVPLDESFMIRVSERRVIDFNKTSPPREGVYDKIKNERIKRVWEGLGRPTVIRSLVSFNDAKSNHLNIRVPDEYTQVKEGKWEPKPDKAPDVAQEPSEKPDDIIDSGELLSYYSANEDRDHMLWFTIPLRQTWPRRITMFFVYGSLLASLVGMIIILADGFCFDIHPYVPVMLIPATFAGALLLVRSNSTLGSRINGCWHILLVGLLSVLFLFTGWLALSGQFANARDLVSGKCKPASTPTPTPTLTVTVTAPAKPPPPPDHKTTPSLIPPTPSSE